MMTTAKKKVNVIVKDGSVMSSIKWELEKLGCEVLSDVKKTRESEIIIFDPYFLELGLVNVIKKENPLVTLVMIGSEEEIRTLGPAPCLCFCDKIVMKDRTNQVGEKIKDWFLENYRHE